MAEHASNNAPGGGETNPPSLSPPKPNRGRIVRFVAVFIVTVLLLLTGYRYSVNHEFNVRYLYYVAWHTSTLLSVVGDKSEVEPLHSREAVRPLEARQKLAAWRGGNQVAAQSEAPVRPEKAPLTPWESWSYKAYRILEEGGDLQNEGPIVYFKFHEGLNSRLAETRNQLRVLSRDGSLTPEEKREKGEMLQAELRRLRAERGRAMRQEGGQKLLRDVYFQFKLVPDCGAIPSMVIFFAAVIAFPTLLWKRVVGVVIGVPLLYGVNLSRLSTIAMIGASDKSQGMQWFNFAHEYVWQGIFIIFVVAFWLAWIEFIVRKRTS